MDTVRFWTDSGPHYKSYECLGSLDMHVPEYFGVSSHVYYGPPAHWKGECDGKFSHIYYNYFIKDCNCNKNHKIIVYNTRYDLSNDQHVNVMKRASSQLYHIIMKYYRL